MPEFSQHEKGGTMRLGARTTVFKDIYSDCLIAKLYRDKEISGKKKFFFFYKNIF